MTNTTNKVRFPYFAMIKTYDGHIASLYRKNDEQTIVSAVGIGDNSGFTKVDEFNTPFDVVFATFANDKRMELLKGLEYEEGFE